MKPSAIIRYQECARKLRELFDEDPLGDSPAEVWVERLEELIARNLLGPLREATVRGKKAMLQVQPTHFESNGEAGDGENVCSICGEPTDKGHTPDECAKLIRSGIESANQQVHDELVSEVSRLEKLVGNKSRGTSRPCIWIDVGHLHLVGKTDNGLSRATLSSSRRINFVEYAPTGVEFPQSRTLPEGYFSCSSCSTTDEWITCGSHINLCRKCFEEFAKSYFTVHSDDMYANAASIGRALDNLEMAIQKRIVHSAVDARDKIEELIKAREVLAVGSYIASKRETSNDPSVCQMGVYCSEHGFIHGAEANELRERIELLIADWDHGSVVIDLEDVADDIRTILDSVDARDSLPALEKRTTCSLVQVSDDTPSGTCVLVLEDELVMSVVEGSTVKGRITKTWTRSAPWRIGSGTLVVSLVGRAGGYSAERCFVLAPPVSIRNKDV